MWPCQSCSGATNQSRPAEQCAHVNFCVVQDDVERLQGSLVVEHTLARVGAEKLWKLMREEAFVPALGALTGNQAMQQIRAGLKAVYCSGWQVGAFQMPFSLPFVL